jgi:hypothetical protein
VVKKGDAQARRALHVRAEVAELIIGCCPT